MRVLRYIVARYVISDPTPTGGLRSVIGQLRPALERTRQTASAAVSTRHRRRLPLESKSCVVESQKRAKMTSG
jgi:predicted transcriptional regulator